MIKFVRTHQNVSMKGTDAQVLEFSFETEWERALIDGTFTNLQMEPVEFTETRATIMVWSPNLELAAATLYKMGLSPYDVRVVEEEQGEYIKAESLGREVCSLHEAVRTLGDWQLVTDQPPTRYLMGRLSYDYHNEFFIRLLHSLSPEVTTQVVNPEYEVEFLANTIAKESPTFASYLKSLVSEGCNDSVWLATIGGYQVQLKITNDHKEFIDEN